VFPVGLVTWVSPFNGGRECRSTNVLNESVERLVEVASHAGGHVQRLQVSGRLADRCLAPVMALTFMVASSSRRGRNSRIVWDEGDDGEAAGKLLYVMNVAVGASLEVVAQRTPITLAIALPISRSGESIGGRASGLGFNDPPEPFKPLVRHRRRCSVLAR